MKTTSVSIQNAMDKGVFALARAAAVDVTPTHFILPVDDFIRIKKLVADPTPKAAYEEARKRWGRVSKASGDEYVFPVSKRPSFALTPEQLEMKESRLSICRTCLHFKRESQRTVSCGKCGCSGASVVRTSDKCPLGKW